MQKSPLIPMAAITGRPDRARMEQVLRDYKSVGIDQFLIYPRSGMEYEYMSPEWMNLCRETVEIAADLNMDIWLYDEYNWPSGNCRGQVTDGHAEYYPNALVFERKESGMESRVVQNRLGADILNPDSVARFLALTHQRYYDALSEYFGTVIKGIFTDEPSFAYFTRNSDGTFSSRLEDDSFLLAWYDGLEAEYHARHGGDLRKDVAAHLNGATPQFLWEDYYRCMGDRMRNVFVRAMDSWCQNHGIVLTGHLMCEDAPQSVRYNGDALKMLSEFSMPGMDEIWTNVDIARHNMELSAAFLAQYASRGKCGALAELFALGPVDLPMCTMRQMIWITACFGVDHYVLAVAALDPKGNIEKNAYYFPTSKTQPWFSHYAQLNESAKQAAQAARKPYAPSLRLRYPATLFMRVLNTEAGQALGQLFRDMLEALVSHQIQALYLAEEEQTSLPVISMDEDGLFLEGETTRYHSAEAMAEHACAMFSRPCVVRDESGVETRDVLVRAWADGSVTLVDLTQNDRADRLLLVECGGHTGRVRLPGRGVFCGKPEDMNDVLPQMLKQAAIGPVSLRLEQRNLLRCSYTQAAPEFTVEARESIGDVRLLLRREPCPVAVTLDGQPVVAENADDRLPDGFAPLYRATQPFLLTKGRHVLRVTNGETDYRYLPAIYFSGNFSVGQDGALTAFREANSLGPVQGIPNYVGSYTLSMEIEVPENPNLVLALDANCACVEVFLDGEALGPRCWAPFAWKIPAHCQGGRRRLALHVSTSVQPMFGDITCFEQEQGVTGLYFRPGKYGATGLMAAPVFWVCGDADVPS